MLTQLNQWNQWSDHWFEAWFNWFEAWLDWFEASALLNQRLEPVHTLPCTLAVALKTATGLEKPLHSAT